MHDIHGGDLLFIPHVHRGQTFFVLTSRRAIDRGGSVKPLWFAALSRLEDFPDLVIWFGEHRGRWPQWRQIVEDFGFDALSDEVRRLQSVTPIQEMIGVAVDRQPDPLTIAFRADLVTRRAIIARHRFASLVELEAFLFWLDEADVASTCQLIQTACLSDPGKLTKRIADIVERAIAGQGGDA